MAKLTRQAVQAVSLFQGLDDKTLELLQEQLPTEQREPGQILVREGETDDDMFLVVTGELEVLKQPSKTQKAVRVATLGPGDWFGEMSLIEPQPRSATVRTVAPSLLLKLSRKHVDELFLNRDIRAYSLLITNIAKELARRLRVADGIMSQVMSGISSSYTRNS